MNKSLLRSRGDNWVVTGISFTIGISGLFSADRDVSRAASAQRSDAVAALAPAQTPAEQRKKYFKRVPSFSNFKRVLHKRPTLSLEDYAAKEKEVSSWEHSSVANGSSKYSFVEDGYCEAIRSLIRLGGIFGFKKYVGAPRTIHQEDLISISQEDSTTISQGNPLIISVDVSFPNLRRVALSRLVGVSDKPITLEYGDGLSAAHPLTPGNLQWLLGESSPLKKAYERIEHPSGSDERDETISGLAAETIDWLANLIIGTDERALFDVSKLKDENKDEFKSVIKRLLANKTGFQRIMSLITAYVLNSSEEERIHFVKDFTGISIEDASGAYFEGSVRSVSLDFKRLSASSDLDWTILHELTHAYHCSIDCCSPMKSKQESTLTAFVNYSIMNSPQVDFCGLFYPMLKPTLQEAPEWDGMSSSERSEYIISWQSGFGDSTRHLCHIFQFEGETALSLDDIKMLWQNPDEMLTMQGICPLLIGNQVYIIEDRQNEDILVNRAGYREQGFRFHLCGKCLDELQKDTNSTYCKYEDWSDNYVLDYRSKSDDAFSLKQIQNLQENLQENLSRMANCVRFNAKLNDKVLTIPADVTSLADEKFHLYPYLERVEFAPGCRLKKINDFSFSKCKLLKEVVLPEGIEEIGFSAFQECKSLRKMAFPEGIKKIGDFAFRECELLEKIIIPNSVTIIGMNAFWGCKHLGEVDSEVLIPGKVVTIGNFAFFESFVGSVRIPNADTITIGANAFRKSKLRHIEAPKGSIKEIGYDAFSECELSSLVLHDGISKIGENAFANCKELTRVEIPGSVREIGSGAFDGCEKLNSLFLGDGIFKIGGNAFAGCKELTQVEIPKSVKEIGACAFNGCNKLNSLFLGEGIFKIGGNAFAGCKELTRVEIPKSVKEIGACAFLGCNGLSSLVLHENIEKIGSSAFAGCKELEQVEILKGVKEIGSRAFYGCDKLSRLFIGDGILKIGERAFADCNGLERVEVPGSVNTIGAYAFSQCNNLKELILHEGIEIINEKAFSCCGSLTHVKIPEGIQTIGRSAFANCSSLQQIEIPESILEIDPSAFAISSVREQKLKIKVSPDIAAEIAQDILDEWGAEIFTQ